MRPIISKTWARYGIIWVVNVALIGILVNLEASSFFDVLERPLVRVAMTLQPRIKPNHVAIISIDNSSIENNRRWPWPEDEFERLINQIADSNPSVIAVNIVRENTLNVDPDSKNDHSSGINFKNIVWLCARPSINEKITFSGSGKNICATWALNYDNGGYVRGLKWSGIDGDQQADIHVVPFALKAVALAKNRTVADIASFGTRIDIAFIGPEGTFRRLSR